MMEPLALVFYERLLTGTQLVNRLQDLRYRVVSVTDITEMKDTAVREKPIVVLADLGSSPQRLKSAVEEIRANGATAHLPIVVFGPDAVFNGKTEPTSVGATLMVSETAILNHLEPILERALLVE